MLGSRTIFPEHDGQLRGLPLRSFEMSWSAWDGLYVAGRGFRMSSPILQAAWPSAGADFLRAGSDPARSTVVGTRL